MSEASARRKQQVIMLVEVIDAAKIEAGAVHTVNGVGSLMEYLPAKGQMFCDLALQ